MSIREEAYERITAALAQAAEHGEQWRDQVLLDAVIKLGSLADASDNEQYNQACNALNAIADAQRWIRAVG